MWVQVRVEGGWNWLNGDNDGLLPPTRRPLLVMKVFQDCNRCMYTLCIVLTESWERVCAALRMVV